MIIDVHSHLNDSQFDSDREDVIARMKEAQVQTITIGTGLEMSKKAIAIAEANNMWATVGQHPVDSPEEIFSEAMYLELAKNSRVVAIGECGLDYYWEKSESGKTRQKELFVKHIELARRVNKPLMLHVRNTYEDAYNILREHGVRGHIHFFAGEWNMAKRFIDLGCTLSFSGVITFTNQYDEVVKNVPRDSYMIETDAPHATPTPYRGRRNEPTYVLETIKHIANLRGTTPEHITEQTTATAKQFFSLGLQI